MQNLKDLQHLKVKKTCRQQGQQLDNQSQCSSQTEQLNQEILSQKKQPGTDLFSQQQQQFSKEQDNQNPGSKEQNLQARLESKSKMELAYDSKPHIKGSQRYYKDGEVYYRTATKFFQPQKHYFHQEQSQIVKTWVYGNGKCTQKILISSWNINGIRNALHKPTICQYIKNAEPDILCMIEVKINQWNYRKRPVKLPGYEGYWNFCKCSAGYSGIAIFSRFQPLAAFEDFEEREFSQEGRVLTLQFQHFYLVAAYIPTAGQNLQRLQYKVNQFQKVFYKHCSKLLIKKHVIVAGDLNVCHTVLGMHVPKIIRKHAGKHPSSTKKEKTNFENFLNIGFVDTFRRLNPKIKKYSWYNIKRLGREKNLGKRLDYFLVNSELMNCVTRSEVLSHLQGSDHCPIQLNIDLSMLTDQQNKIREEKNKVREQYITKNFMPRMSLEKDKQQTLKAITSKQEYDRTVKKKE